MSSLERGGLELRPRLLPSTIDDASRLDYLNNPSLGIRQSLEHHLHGFFYSRGLQTLRVDNSLPRAGHFNFEGAVFDEEDGDFIVRGAIASQLRFGGNFHGRSFAAGLSQLGYDVQTSEDGGRMTFRIPKIALSVIDYISDLRVGAMDFAERDFLSRAHVLPEAKSGINAGLQMFLKYLIASSSQITEEILDQVIVQSGPIDLQSFTSGPIAGLAANYIQSSDDLYWFQALKLFIPKVDFAWNPLQFFKMLCERIPGLELLVVMHGGENVELTLRYNFERI